MVRIDLLVQGDQYASSSCVVAAGKCDCLQKVQRAISTQCGGGPHCAHDNDRLGRVHRHLQEEGCLFERVRAMRDHNTSDFVLGQLGSDTVSQSQRDCLVD
jgi:hypothetical protein